MYSSQSENAIITDTGFWVALANENDCHHEIAKQKLHELSTTNIEFITTWLPTKLLLIVSYITIII